MRHKETTHLGIIVLAAGKGSRMLSDLPKVLHPLAGKPLLQHVVDCASPLSPHIAVVIGHQAEQVQQTLSHLNVHWMTQTQQWGTAHAVEQAMPAFAHFKADHRVLVLYGDVPLIRFDLLYNFIQSIPNDVLGVVTTIVDNPTGFGRIVRDPQHHLTAIVEEKDATTLQKKIHEINTGIMIAPYAALKNWLTQVNNHNASKEYYLTDIIHIAKAQGTRVETLICPDPTLVLGVNTRQELATLERAHQLRSATKWMLHGIHIIDPHRIDFRGDIEIGRDTTIDINVILDNVRIGKHCHMGANSILKNCTLADHVRIEPYSYIDGAQIGEHCQVGPYARLRPQTHLEPHVKVGNFVEVKKSHLGQYSKVNHLSYIGDAQVGEYVNIGAGTITCNYDGKQKHPTIIKDHAFIGSNSALVAPVSVGKHATVGAGSTICRDVPDQHLALTRTPQTTQLKTHLEKNDSKE